MGGHTQAKITKETEWLTNRTHVTKVTIEIKRLTHKYTHNLLTTSTLQKLFSKDKFYKLWEGETQIFTIVPLTLVTHIMESI